VCDTCQHNALNHVSDALSTLQEMTGSHNPNNPWLGIVSALALAQMDGDALRTRLATLTAAAEGARVALDEIASDAAAGRRVVRRVAKDALDILTAALAHDAPIALPERADGPEAQAAADKRVRELG
jgi:hypothetical protein